MINQFDSVWEERCELLAENWRLKARIAQLENPRKPDATLQASLLQEAQNNLTKILLLEDRGRGGVWTAFNEYLQAVERLTAAGAANYADVQIDLASSQGKVRQLEEQVEALTEEVRCLKRNPDWDRS